MKTAAHFRIALIFSLPFWVACFSVPAERRTAAVRQRVERRMGLRPEKPLPSAGRGALPADYRNLLDDGLTLDEAVRIALVNNSRLLATYEELNMASARWLQERLLPNPEAEGLLQVSEHDSTHRVWEVGVHWNVLDAMLQPVARRLAEDRLGIAELDAVKATMAYIYRVRDGFYRLLAAQKVYALQQTVTAAAEASYEMATRLRDAGNIKELDLLNNRSLYEQAKIDLSAAEFEVSRRRETVNVLLGLWGSDAEWTTVQDLPDIPDDPLSAEDLERRVIENSLDLAAARHHIQTAARELGIAKIRSVIPRVHLGVDAEREPDHTWLVGPTISLELPVFDHGQAARPLAEAALRQRWKRYGALAVEIRSAARLAREKARLARRRAIYYRDTVLPLRARITHRTQLQYNAMQLGVFRLIQTRQMEIEAQRRYIQELCTYWLARNDMEQLLRGRLGAAETASFSPPSPIGSPGNGGH